MLRTHCCLLLRKHLWILNKLLKWCWVCFWQSLTYAKILASTFFKAVLYHKSCKPNFYHLWLSPSFRYSYNTMEDSHGVILNSLHLVDFREDLSSTPLGFPTSHVWIFSCVFFCLFILSLGQN